MRSAVQLAAGVVLAVVAAGCGGGHRITEPPPPQPTPQPTGNVIRQIQPGDIMTASVAGTLTGPGGTGPVSGSVTLSTHQDVAPPSFGARALRVVVEYDITQPSGTTLEIQSNYYEQDSAGNLYFMGSSTSTVNARLTSTSAPPLSYPSPMNRASSNAFTARFADGSRADRTITVVGLEAVGAHMAYRVHVVTSDTSASSEDYWFVPDLGYPVKWTQTIQQGTSRFVMTATVTSRNF